MPEPQDPDASQDQDGSVGNSTIQEMRKQIKELEKKAKEADTAVAERDALKADLAGFQRVAAFDRLQIPPTGAGKLFRDTYTGDLTDDVILAKAVEYGVVQAPQQQTTSTIPGVDADAFARMQQSLSGTATQTIAPAIEQINAAKNSQDLVSLLRELGAVGD